MPLYLPPSFSLKALNGGYNANADFNTLKDNESNDAMNIEIKRNGPISSRNGYVRMLNSALTETGVKSVTGLSADSINGHYQILKAGPAEVSAHIVGAGKNLWNYTSSTAQIILSNINEDCEWYFTQIQDPRASAAGADDCVVGVNGCGYPIVWNGQESSAVYLNDIAESSGVQVAKYIASVKGRIILANINDPSDVDSESKFILSGFDSAGVATPHIFPPELQIYAGGADRYGGIQGIAPLNGNVVIFKNNTTYRFNIGGGTSVDPATLSIVHDFSLQQIDENIGCIAPRSIATIGNAIILLSDYGVYAFDGVNFRYIGKGIEDNLENINFALKKKASGVFHRDLNEYWLSVAESGKNYNNIVFRYDITNGIWHPPYDNMRCNIMSNFREANQEKILSGDHMGYLYELNKGTADGFETGYNLVPTTMTDQYTLNFADSQALPIAGDGYLGIGVYAVDGDGVDSTIRMIVNATGTQIVVDNAFGASITTSTTFSIGGIRAYFKTKDYDFGNPDLDKVYRNITVRAKQLGDFNFMTNYIIDFNEISNAGTATINQYNDNYMAWGVSATGTSTPYSGTIETISVATSQVTVSGCSGLPTAGSGLQGYVLQLWNSGTRYLRPIASNDSGVIQLGLYGTASQIATDSDTSYYINTNLAGAAGTGKWGPAKTKINNKSLRFLNTQPLMGKYFSLRFSTQRANEPWEIHGFDVLTKIVGRRS